MIKTVGHKSTHLKLSVRSNDAELEGEDRMFQNPLSLKVTKPYKSPWSEKGVWFVVSSQAQQHQMHLNPKPSILMHRRTARSRNSSFGRVTNSSCDIPICANNSWSKDASITKPKKLGCQLRRTGGIHRAMRCKRDAARKK